MSSLKAWNGIGAPHSVRHDGNSPKDKWKRLDNPSRRRLPSPKWPELARICRPHYWRHSWETGDNREWGELPKPSPSASDSSSTVAENPQPSLSAQSAQLA
jgi:hypothetical protein